MSVNDTHLVKRLSETRARSLVGLVLACLIGVISLVGVAAPVAAQGSEAGQIELSARAGYDGYYKGDFWVPVQVRVANGGPEIQGHLQITIEGSGGSDEAIYRSPVLLPTLSNKAQTLYVHVPQYVTALTVELLDEDDQLIASTQTSKLSSLTADALLYAVVTREPGRLEFLEDVSGGRSEAAVAYLRAAELPDVAASLNAIDVVIIHNEDSGQLTADQRQALESWLDTGGQLVVTGGPGWQETTAGLDDLLPVQVSGTRSLEDIPALRALSNLSFRDPGPYLVTESTLRGGESIVHQDGLPLLVRRGIGRGSLYFLALDPSLAPLLDWQGSKALWAEIAGSAQPLPGWANGARNSYAAANAVSSLPASDLPGAGALFVFLMVYVTVVGPLNYLVLRRLGRRELAWLTIPVLVLLFSVTAYLVGFQLKGNETILNQMSIIYGQTEGDQGRVQTLVGLYSPRRTIYDMTFPSEAIPRRFNPSFGLSGEQGTIEAEERAEGVTIADIRVDVGGVETLVANSYQDLPAVTGSVRLRPESGHIIVDILVQNNGSVTLENATILAGSDVFSLGDLAPGDQIERSERVTSHLATPAGAGAIGSYVAPPPTTSPLLANADTILGSADFYNDREIYPRWQLLQALAPEYGQSAGSYAPNTFTLVAWSEQPQLDLGLINHEYSSVATSLYFLELPASQEFSNSSEMVVPRQFLDWTVLAADNIYEARTDDLFLTQGSVEFEFRPWSEFQSMSVQDLSVVLQAPAGLPAQPPPQISLWDWGAETWWTSGDSAWGRIAIEDPLRHVGPNNAVRIRLSNFGPEAITIQHIYPELSGSVE